MVLSGVVGGSNPHAYGHRELLFMGEPSVPLESSGSNLKTLNLFLNGMWQGGRNCHIHVYFSFIQHKSHEISM
jgi:hypothetical protein